MTDVEVYGTETFAANPEGILKLAYELESKYKVRAHVVSRILSGE
jgi:hypothetical protein